MIFSKVFNYVKFISTAHFPFNVLLCLNVLLTESFLVSVLLQNPQDTKVPSYALPEKSRISVQSPDVVGSMSSGSPLPSDLPGSQSRQNVSLSEMMKTLDDNMTRQGVTTIPKGHCAACAKPIVGQVRICLLSSVALCVYHTNAKICTVHTYLFLDISQFILPFREPLTSDTALPIVVLQVFSMAA